MTCSTSFTANFGWAARKCVQWFAASQVVAREAFIVGSKRKITQVLTENETGVPGGLPAFAADVQAEVDALLPVYADDHDLVCYACLREAPADALHCRCCSNTVHTAVRCVGSNRLPGEMQWVCHNCQTRIDAARVRVVAARLASGELAAPLVGGRAPTEAEELELDHAIDVLVGSRHSPRIAARLARGTRGRQALAALIQRIEWDCLASDVSYSFRALLASAPAGGCGIIYKGK